MQTPLASLRRSPFHRTLALLALLALAACIPPATPGGEEGPALALPAMRSFSGATRPQPVLRPNAQMARDFLELAFRLESGRELPVLSRFEGPVTVRVEGAAPPTLLPDLERLLARLRREAGIAIHYSAAPAPEGADAGNSITVSVVPRAELLRAVPQAACFVSPRVSGWAEFRRSRLGARADWTTLARRRQMAVFIPAEVAPQELRDCLHEELAQALGPPNDLFRLPDSVFNDDNFHGILTGFDMLMLRLIYAPEFRAGMRRAEVEARLPAVLRRLNPRGGAAVPVGESRTPETWVQAVERALDRRLSDRRRLAAARSALQQAQRAGWEDGRRAFALYLLGRLSVGEDAEAALAAFEAARAIYGARPESAVQAAHLDMQLAAHALGAGQLAEVLARTGRAIPVARQAENAALLTQLQLMRAAVLEQQGRAREAALLRAEALGWARYGFGDAGEVRALVAGIAALAGLQQVAER